MEQQFRTILIDPPWPQVNSGKRCRDKGSHGDKDLPYPTMSLAEILMLPIGALAAPDCHLWLWTTNQFLAEGILLMRAWGFKYLSPIHMVKPSGVGNYFVQRTQTILMGYKERCVFEGKRYLPNLIEVSGVSRHSEKPDRSYEYIESVSQPDRLEMFARRRRPGWKVWGNEVDSDIQITVGELSEENGE